MQNFDESSARRRPMYVPDYARIRFCGSKLIPGRSRIATVSHHGSRGPPPVAGHGISSGLSLCSPSRTETWGGAA
jgi:hypothetical protein